jgi:hypothetical protein
MKNRWESIRLITATVVIAIVNNIGLRSFDRVNAASVILSERHEELVTTRRPDRGWTYLFTPDYLGQKIHVRVITPPKMPSINWSYISTLN